MGFRRGVRRDSLRLCVNLEFDIEFKSRTNITNSAFACYKILKE